MRVTCTSLDVFSLIFLDLKCLDFNCTTEMNNALTDPMNYNESLCLSRSMLSLVIEKAARANLHNVADLKKTQFLMQWCGESF